MSEAKCKDIAKTVRFSKVKYYGPKNGGPLAGWVTESGTTICSATGNNKGEAMEALLSKMQNAVENTVGLPYTS